MVSALLIPSSIAVGDFLFSQEFPKRVLIYNHYLLPVLKAESERALPRTGSLSKCALHIGTGQAEDRSWESHADVLWEWAGSPSYLSDLAPAVSQEAGMRSTSRIQTHTLLCGRPEQHFLKHYTKGPPLIFREECKQEKISQGMSINIKGKPCPYRTVLSVLLISHAIIKNNLFLDETPVSRLASPVLLLWTF